MGKRVTVKCTECGATHRVLADRLGQKRPCPKCGLQFELDEESNQSTYDLNVRPGSRPATADSPDTPDFTEAWDEEDFAPAAPEPTPDLPSESPTADTPMLKRGIHRQTEQSGSRGGKRFVWNSPLVISAGVVLSILAALAVHLLTRPGGDDLPGSTPSDDTDSPSATRESPPE